MRRLLLVLALLVAAPAWASCDASKEVLKTFLAAGIDTFDGRVAAGRKAALDMEASRDALAAQVAALTAQRNALQAALTACQQTPPPPPPPPPPTGPTYLGRWLLNEGTGTTVADSGTGAHNGTLVNTPSWVTPGQEGAAALRFDGTARYAEIPHHADYDFGEGPFMVHFWVRTKTHAGPYPLVAKLNTGGGWMIGANYGRVLINIGGAERYTATDRIPHDTWTRVVVSRDSLSVLRVCINGVGVPLESQQSTVGANSTANLRFGAMSRSWPGDARSFYADAELDDIRVAARVATTDDGCPVTPGTGGGTGGGGGTTTPPPTGGGGGATGSGTFCTQQVQKLGAQATLRCNDFQIAAEADTQYGGNLWDSSLSATGGGGSLGWRIKSLNQVKAENPQLSTGRAWQIARATDTGNWQRWIGRQLAGHETMWVQFKFRFNQAYLTRWGGNGPKIWGFDAGCRLVNGVMQPPGCSYDIVGPNMGTAMSMELTATTYHWHRASTYANAHELPYMILYQGSTNWALSRSIMPYIPSHRLNGSLVASGTLEQNGPTMWGWNGTEFTNPCSSSARLADPTGQKNRCKTYGNPDTWHTITIQLKPGTYRDTNPATADIFRHDTLLRVWYDGTLTHDFDPDRGPWTTGKPTAEQCRATQGWTEQVDFSQCQTGIDAIRDSREKPPASSWPVASVGANDPGSQLTQFILWTFSYPRGRPPMSFCETDVGPADSAYGECKSLAIGDDDTSGQAWWQDFVGHSEVRVNMDDVLITTTPLIGSTGGGGTFAAPYEIDAANIQNAPVLGTQRVWFGPEKTFWNTGHGYGPDGTYYNKKDSAEDFVNCTNYAREFAVSSAVPLGGGYHVPRYGNGKILYFGGGHSGYMANRVNEMDVASGRWSQSQYTPDINCIIAGAIGPQTPTPPGIGCVNDGAKCQFGGAPNGSPGGRGWWEHNTFRYAYDMRLGGWMFVQNSGTWLYRHTDETWTHLRPYWSTAYSFLCGASDYTKSNTVWNAVTNSMWFWCSSDILFEWDYAASTWVQRAVKPQNLRNPHTDILSQAVVTNSGKIYLYEQYAPNSGNIYEIDYSDPMITRFTPGTGAFQVLDRAKANHPQGDVVRRKIDPVGQPYADDPCIGVKCVMNTQSMAYDPVGDALLVAGRAAGTHQLFLWRLRNPDDDASQWDIVTIPNAPEVTGDDYAMGDLVYVPEKDVLLWFSRRASGDGGAGGPANSGLCAITPGVEDACFKAWAFKLPRS